MITLKDIAFTIYPVTDVARARVFYEEVLGLTTGVTFQHDSRYWIEYDVGRSTLAISNMASDRWKPSPDGPSVALEVDDFDEAVAHLRAQGVRFGMEPIDTGACRMAILTDPDGNSLAIHQRSP